VKRFRVLAVDLEIHEGDAFFEPHNKTMLHFDNASDTDPMTFIAFHLLDGNDRELIHMLE